MSVVRDFPPLAVSNRDETQEAIGVVAKSTDASKLSFPLPLVIGAIMFAASVVGSMWMVVSDVRDIRTRMEMQKEIDAVNAKLLEERFKSLESQIQAAGLRNAAMAMSQELQKQKEK